MSAAGHNVGQGWRVREVSHCLLSKLITLNVCIVKVGKVVDGDVFDLVDRCEDGATLIIVLVLTTGTTFPLCQVLAIMSNILAGIFTVAEHFRKYRPVVKIKM